MLEGEQLANHNAGNRSPGCAAADRRPAQLRELLVCGHAASSASASDVRGGSCRSAVLEQEARDEADQEHTEPWILIVELEGLLLTDLGLAAVVFAHLA